MNLITRAEARAKNLSHYFTGKPCKRGHLAERATGTGRCVECNKIICAQWKSNNQEIKRDLDRKYRQANKEKVAANSAAWYLANRELTIQRAGQHAKNNRDAARLRRQGWKDRNPEYATLSEGIRRARKRRAVPPWFGELDQFVWLEAADLVRLRRSATGIDWASDHMIALASDTASGLHVWNNCQVIPGALNLSKNNKLTLTEPLEWLQHI